MMINLPRRMVRSIGEHKYMKVLALGGAIFCLFIVMSLVGIFVMYHFFGMSSSNAVLYFIKDIDGWLKVTNDLSFSESDKLIFMFDGSCILRFLEGVASSTYNEPLLELAWNEDKGKGILKEFRPDGTKFLVVLSRYEEEEGIPMGLFVGGDLAFGDIDRWEDRSRNNTGISYFDGKQWIHIWCSINEAITVKGIEKPIEPWQWKYLGSKRLKVSSSEILIHSTHELDTIDDKSEPVKLLMRRTFYKRKGDDYITMRVEYSNMGGRPVELTYSFGDEPWVGEFGSSSGDIGWTNDRLFKRESYILPRFHKFAGFWDFGNDEAGEGHNFTGYANFVQWRFNPPSIVYFSNDFSLLDFREGRVLNSRDNRVINLLWLSQILIPQGSKTYEFVLGMAKPDPFTGLPVKPEVGNLKSAHSF